MVRVTVDTSAIRAFGKSTAVDTFMARLGEQIADDARAAAPKDSGAMAASIDYEVGFDSNGPYVRVSWDDAHFYGLFSEVGTSRQSPQPFLRPVLEKRRTL